MFNSNKTKRSGCKQATYRQRYCDLITSLYYVGNAKGEFPHNLNLLIHYILKENKGRVWGGGRKDRREREANCFWSQQYH